MTRRHFNLLAKTIANAAKDLELRPDQVERMARIFAADLQTTNGAFNCDRFVEAVLVNRIS